MNIVMMTNTYKPILGGLEKSIEVFSSEYRKRGHHVLIVAPEFKDASQREYGVLRVPAIQNFNGTDFSVELPVPNHLFKAFKKFRPDIIHTHHPFLIGDTALRMSAPQNIPIIFTNHTLYEKNTHYVPGDSKAMKQFVVRLATGFANLCDHVIAPSQSVADLLISRGVRTPVTVLPTGIDVEKFKTGNCSAFRKLFGIPQDAFVAGIISRMAPEKNIVFLSQAAAVFLAKNKNAWFVVVGDGPSLDEIKTIFRELNVESRLVCAGSLKDTQLVNAYHALNVFAFASHSETQGLVLAEAMAAGTPVAAVDAPGVREVVKDKMNGRLIPRDNVGQFANALQWMADLSAAETAAM
ncbi:MAG: glycosyl transferase family 1, partial [Candidatus Omnitrophica bacterium CG12_big_fil_rev_8_21_14_0_65_50_5]